MALAPPVPRERPQAGAKSPQYDNANVLSGQIQPQGVQFAVDTTGYTNISFQFDWNEGGISDMQPQYSPDGGTTWVNVPYVAGDTGINNNGSDLIEATVSDFYGAASTKTTSAATLTAGTSANIAVASSTAFVVGQTVTITTSTGTVSATVNRPHWVSCK